MRDRWRRLLLTPLLLLPLSMAECPFLRGTLYLDYRVVELTAGPDIENQAREAALTAKPGTIIQFPAGTFQFSEELTIDVPNVTVRGRGMYQTVLDFSDQVFGAQGILATADEFAIQDIAIENPKGDGVRAEGVKGAIFERVRVEWTGGPSAQNGAYGLYPVSSEDVYVSGCIVKGASDAGIYVGQSRNIVVRLNLVQFNVAGIEIENSFDADVYSNVATGNTGGILVFDLPGLPVQGGMRTRIFDNLVFKNNTNNFAPPGNIVGLVPGGTGILIMANEDIEVFNNTIMDHETVNLVVTSYLITFVGNSNPPTLPANYDPYSERIHIHDNKMGGGGTRPRGDLGIVASVLFAQQGSLIPDVLIGGWVNFDLYPDGILPPEKNLCIHDNGGASVGNLNALLPGTPATLYGPAEPSPYADCSHPSLPGIAIGDAGEIPEPELEFTEEQIAALCAGGDPDAVNWDAFIVDCPLFSDYRLFLGDPRDDPRAGGVPYDLTTPLFSDYAQKYRFVFLPPGTAARYEPTASFDFPVGTMIAKTFAFRAELGDEDSPERLVESRLLIRRESGWVGRAWIYDADESAARLAVGGGLAPVEFLHTDGTLRSFLYQVPDINQCARCHFGDGVAPIGPKARFLNRDLEYADIGPRNQIRHWSDRGLLLDAPANPETESPRLAVWDDPSTGTLEERARAYLEANCAFCHNPAGRARFSGMFLEAHQPLDASYGICKKPTAAGGGAGALNFDIVPGSPELSILIFRLASLEPAVKMPELSKATVHDEGVALVSDWIASLPAQSCQ